MQGFRICRIFGIDIELHWTWLFIFALFEWDIASNFLPHKVPGQPAILYWVYGILVILVFFISVLFHEMSHSMVTRKYKIPIQRITLFLFGGAAQMGERPKMAKAEFWMTLAGPVSSLVAAGLFLAIASIADGALPALALAGLYWLGVINIFLAVFNMLPIFPMDGGRILRSLCWWGTKDLVKATRVAVNVALVMAVILTVGFFFISGWFSALFVGAIFWLSIIPQGFAEYNEIKNG